MIFEGKLLSIHIAEAGGEAMMELQQASLIALQRDHDIELLPCEHNPAYLLNNQSRE